MQEIVMGILRHVLTTGAGALLSKGLVDQSESEILVSSLLGLIGVGLSIWHKIQIKQQAEAAVPSQSSDVSPKTGLMRIDFICILPILIIIGGTALMCLPIIGCDAESPEKVQTPAGEQVRSAPCNWDVRSFDGHWFITGSGDSYAIVHHPDCPCHQKAVQPKTPNSEL